MCLDYLLKSKGIENFSLIVFDDGSADLRIFEFLQTNNVRYFTQKRTETRSSVASLACRVGEQRRIAVDYFLNSNHQIVVLLDDDVLVSAETLLEAISEFEFLQEADWANAGAYTLRSNVKPSPKFRVDGKAIGRIQFSGEGHVILSRKSLERVGNHFSSDRKGFGDNQFKAFINAGYHYYCRLSPHFPFQHLGFGRSGSVIHKNLNEPPMWVKRPYVGDYNEIVQVPGFDIHRYIREVERVGGDKAPLAYLGEQKEREMDKISDEITIQGKMSIIAQNEKTGERKVLFEDKNLVLTTLRTQIARLVGGDQELLGGVPTRYIEKVGIGTNNTAPTVTDTALTNAQSVDISLYEETGAKRIHLQATFPAVSPANGVEYKEAGLLFKYPAGALATRRVFDGFLKTAEWAWEINWELYYA